MGDLSDNFSTIQTASKWLTRIELERQGVLLDGPIVPSWFKTRCVDCSAPKPFKDMSMVSRLTSACEIHDARYTVIPVVFKKGSKELRRARKHADKEFFNNCKLIVGAYGKRRWRGVFLTRIVYSAVRTFGRWAIGKRDVQGHRMPKTNTELSDWCSMVEECYMPSEQSKRFEKSLETFINHLEAN